MKKLILPLIVIILIAGCKKDLKQTAYNDTNNSISKPSLTLPASSSRVTAPQMYYSLPIAVINEHKTAFVNAHLNPILTSKVYGRGGCDRIDGILGEVTDIQGVTTGSGGCNDHYYAIIKYRLYLSIAVRSYDYINDGITFTVTNPVSNDVLFTGTAANATSIHEEADITNVIFDGTGHVTYSYEFTVTNYHDQTNISFGFVSGSFQSNNGFSSCSAEPINYSFPYELICSGFISHPGNVIIYANPSIPHSMNVGTLHCNILCYPDWYQFSTGGDFYYSTDPGVANPTHLTLHDCPSTPDNTGALIPGATYYYYFTENYPCGITPPSPIQSFTAP